MSTDRPCDLALRQALAIGELRRNSNRGWQFRRRHFSSETVYRAIARGEAIRDGLIVRAAPQQERGP